MRIIETETDIEEGTAALTAACRHLAKVHVETGAPPLRRRPDGFRGLAQIIVGQQLSIASADAIWRRLETAIRPFDAAAFLRVDTETLRTCGLSAGKVATLRGLSNAVVRGEIDLESLRDKDDAALYEALTALKGIGPWTADIYMMFCLGHADAWSPGDLALQYAVMDALGLEKRPSAADMSIIGEAWRPWRGVAARLLWSYYALRRKKAA
ncbi:DNA-3-methyladenine glycosylase [Methyloligella halotolerans]|uniref:DNA-3-methyladenine glycosylase II n=1 Tax=Methyloligella halotolerans TaxID=1177755 RepID=A0A1E2RVE9_9HYPH|nr:DNA-3-methyladenine glycosylase [Methyloligella halotolerans]ODA66105.1 DNA-3-methyladenine glycosylase [Methyloligella halotolerans]